MFSCQFCDVSIQKESGMRKHSVLKHHKKWRKNKPAEDLKEPKLSQEISKYRWQQASGATRRKMKFKLQEASIINNEETSEDVAQVLGKDWTLDLFWMII